MIVVRPFVIAWHFLTAVPLRASYHDPTPCELGRSMLWFPLVGLLIGGFLAAGDRVLSAFLAPSVVNLLIIVLLIVVTRGLHLDGLADTIDGLAGGRTPEERLAIMRDPHLGALGAAGLVLALGLRYAALMAVPQADRLSILIAMPAVGRWTMIIGSGSAPYARRDGGLAQPFLQQLSIREVTGGTAVLAVALIWALGPIGALIVGVISAVIAYGAAAFARRLLGGITGDTLGAINELAEVLFLLAAPSLRNLESTWSFAR